MGLNLVKRHYNLSALLYLSGDNLVVGTLTVPAALTFSPDGRLLHSSDLLRSRDLLRLVDEVSSDRATFHALLTDPDEVETAEVSVVHHSHRMMSVDYPHVAKECSLCGEIMPLFSENSALYRPCHGLRKS